jgi:hypothetical protein
MLNPQIQRTFLTTETRRKTWIDVSEYSGFSPYFTELGIVVLSHKRPAFLSVSVPLW